MISMLWGRPRQTARVPSRPACRRRLWGSWEPAWRRACLSLLTLWGWAVLRAGFSAAGFSPPAASAPSGLAFACRTGLALVAFASESASFLLPLLLSFFSAAV